MKKILHLTQTDIRSDSRILKEINVAVIEGYKVLGLGISLDEDVSHSKLIDSASIHCISLFSKRLSLFPKTIIHFFVFVEFLIRSFYQAVKFRPDIIHCNDTLVLPIGVLVKLFTKSKIIYDAHELESNRNGLTVFLGKVTLYIEKILWRFVDALIVVSPSIESWYQSHVGDKLSTVILNSPVISCQTECEKNDYLREHFGIPKEQKIFIYVGILGSGRGIELILNAFERGEGDSCLVFLGYGALSSSLKEVSRKNVNVYVHDAVKHEDVVTIAQSADVGLCLIQNVSLSDYYCLPNKLFEYCFSGIPVLASNFPDISAVVLQYNLGLCVDLDAESIVEGIKKFERNEVDASFRVKDLSELSWETQAQKLKNLYEKVIFNEVG